VGAVKDPHAAARRLVAEAFARGSLDNMSAVVVKARF
jgi:serine/threonine protein phosphatase PrpC